MPSPDTSAYHRRPPVSGHVATLYDAAGQVIRQGALLAWHDGADEDANPPIVGGWIDPRRPITKRRYWFADDPAPVAVDTTRGERITVILVTKGR